MKSTQNKLFLRHLIDIADQKTFSVPAFKQDDRFGKGTDAALIFIALGLSSKLCI